MGITVSDLHVLTTHPQKNKLFSGYLLACCFLTEGCVYLVRKRKSGSQKPFVWSRGRLSASEVNRSPHERGPP